MAALAPKFSHWEAILKVPLPILFRSFPRAWVYHLNLCFPTSCLGYFLLYIPFHKAMELKHKLEISVLKALLIDFLTARATRRVKLYQMPRIQMPAYNCCMCVPYVCAGELVCVRTFDKCRFYCNSISICVYARAPGAHWALLQYWYLYTILWQTLELAQKSELRPSQKSQRVYGAEIHFPAFPPFSRVPGHINQTTTAGKLHQFCLQMLPFNLMRHHYAKTLISSAELAAKAVVRRQQRKKL